MRPTLTDLQIALLATIAGMDGVHLTGGAALGHYYFGHRGSLDLDFFTPDVERIHDVAASLLALCAAKGFEVSEERRFPGFLRFRVSNDADSTLVDIAHDPVPQTVPVDRKPQFDGIRVDALDDILANKLGAILGRGETKDLVDLYVASRNGHDILSHLPAASARDGGLEPTTLAWVLSAMRPDPTSLILFVELSTAELETFRDELVHALQRTSWPD